MRWPPPARSFALPGLPPVAALLCLAALLPGAARGTMRMTTEVLGAPLEIEVAAGGPAAESALRDAVTAVQEVVALTAVAHGPLAELNAATGAGPRAVPPALLAILRRAAEFCRWSEGSYGPLAGRLHELWGLRLPRPAAPPPLEVDDAAADTGCERLQLDPAAGQAALAAGARLDLWGFARGAAVDAAVERLAARGFRNASVTLGQVQRGAGAGPGGIGWPLRVELPADLAPFTRRLTLQDRAFALASRAAGALRAGGSEHAPYLDHRRGRPGTGVVATAAVTDHALDAEALAATAFVTGNRRGAQLMGQLRPSPAVLWLLGGDGGGAPLVTDYRWGALPRDGSPR